MDKRLIALEIVIGVTLGWLFPRAMLFLLITGGVEAGLFVALHALRNRK